MLYPIGVQNFESLRNGGYVYVDKTELIYKLAATGKYYFLSRPRRFGKSLLLSSMEAYFLGKKELFKGLALESLTEDWIEYPVFHLDLNGVAYNDESVLNQVLEKFLSEWENKYGVTSSTDVPGLRFMNVIDAAYKVTGKQVVVLIDEYDKPIVDNLGNEKLMNSFRTTLQGFFSVLKSKDEKIRFGFLTGVSKLGKLSVFSSLNNLQDISMNKEYAHICGITEQELYKYFNESVDELAAENNISRNDCFGQLKNMYDGYHFCENTPGIYNPFSILNTFKSNSFKEYWFETGTPTMLVNVMKRTSFDITKLSDNVVVSSFALNGMQDIVNKPVPLFFQTGYLTIKEYDSEYKEYRLGFPNDEVKNGFLNFIYSYYVPVNPAEDSTRITQLSKALRSGNPEEFMHNLEALFANTSYQIQGDAEKDFQYAIYIIMELLGEHVEAERTTSNGRIDLLLQTNDDIYIIELKIDSSADEALKQIEDKGYAKPFVSDKRKIHKIGVSFSTKTRRIEEWKVC